MTWSYSGNPADSDLDRLRFLIGDVDSNDQQLSDEELNFLLAQNSIIVQAAVGACDAIIAKYSRLVDQKTGDIDTKYSQRIAAYENLKKALPTSPAATDDSAPSPWPVPYAGGISEADMDTETDDEDRVGPVFAVGMGDYPTDVPTGSGGTGGVL